MKTEVNDFIKTHPIDTIYILVQWPFVQSLMEHDWFRAECLLYQAFDDQEHIDSAYFVPLQRIFEVGMP